jgi:hypothetical protein
VPASSDPGSALKRATRAFGHFWWDFLIGDTPELTVAVVVILGLVALLVRAAKIEAVWAVAPALVAVALSVSVARGRRRR